MSKMIKLKRIPFLIKVEYKILLKKYGYDMCVKSVENLNADSYTKYLIRDYLKKIKR